MKNLANETTTTLPYAYPKLLKVLSLLVTLTDSPRNMLVQFKLVLETIFAALRQIVFSLERIIGKPVVDTIIDNIKCIERALKRLLEEYLNNDVSNLSHGKKADFEPVMKCLQKLTNTLALIGNAILENPSLATVEALESMTVLCLVLAQCLTYIQGTISTIAIIIHSKTNRIPQMISSCLQSSDSLIVGLGEAIDSLVNITLSTCLNLLKNLGNVSAKLNATLKSLLGIATGLPMGLNKVTECLSCGFSSVAGGLNYFFG